MENLHRKLKDKDTDTEKHTQLLKALQRNNQAAEKKIEELQEHVVRKDNTIDVLKRRVDIYTLTSSSCGLLFERLKLLF